ncbi:hypothetical protein Bca52824_064346 [Brassica carinata]|uniref:Uncharacterized protein n=1 Tax=Brassica carinata TaxID=52824 RepID=A0A8X7UA22_BRACI|nr:hypothetical protein Bca52824_064346 [Brassica carinata]
MPSGRSVKSFSCLGRELHKLWQLRLATTGAHPAGPEWAQQSAFIRMELGGLSLLPDLERYYESSVPDSIAAIWFTAGIGIAAHVSFAFPQDWAHVSCRKYGSKVTSVRQFRLNSSLYVSGPMARAGLRSFFLCGTMPGEKGMRRGGEQQQDNYILAFPP